MVVPPAESINNGNDKWLQYTMSESQKEFPMVKTSIMHDDEGEDTMGHR